MCSDVKDKRFCELFLTQLKRKCIIFLYSFKKGFVKDCKFRENWESEGKCQKLNQVKCPQAR